MRVWLALPGLDHSRFWDEQFSVENVCSLLGDGELRPANGLHPGLSYLPHAAVLWASERLHAWTGNARFAVLAGDDDLTPTGYLLCRLLQALAGTLSLYLTWHIGRRLDAPATGAAAALLLAVVPWHLRQSAIFKPDILLIAASLGAFAAALAAAERPGWRRFAAAGAAVGVALATKFNAAPIALPLAVAALAGGGWRHRERWGALVLAGAAAIAVFLLFTPYLAVDPGFYVWSFGRTWRDYAMKGALLHSSHLTVLAQGPAALLSESFHGPVVGALGLAGLVLAPLAASRQPAAPEGTGAARRLGPLMMASYVLGFALFTAAGTTNPSEHNWLPVAPFVAIAAAWMLRRAWVWLVPRLRAWQRLAVGAAAAAAACFLAAPANAYVYDTWVPPTQSLAQDYLEEHLHPLGWRVAVREEDPAARWYSRPAIVLEVKELSEMPPAELDLADAEIFHARRLERAGGSFYRRRIETPGAEVATFEPGPFHARGPAVMVIVHRWDAWGDPQALALSPRPQAPERLAAELPAPPADRRGPGVASLEVRLPPDTDPELLRDVLLAGQPLSPVFTRREAGAAIFVTERFAMPAPGSRVTVVLARPLSPADGVGLRLQRWHAPAGAEAPAVPRLAPPASPSPAAASPVPGRAARNPG